ncbi:hypothetical protein [Sphingomonas sp. S2-65]|uniref:hypothetical protein n=1 Tax=Sphingomonas sp. S2-65 TaxID=2903960 RepID=UPI001F4091B9|nr:hypothetical protein [Sphingomonas sp. S2-65]UYY57555.1 hypothetical protein LZ586_12900 [Sphingomonas sp. S2-65]
MLLFALPEKAAAQGEDPAQGQPTEVVRGVLVMHWEYPHFVRKDANGERVYELDLSRVTWWKKRFFDPLTPESMLLTPLFCISARGYVDKDRLGETGRATFVFTEITSTIEVKVEAACGGQQANR